MASGGAGGTATAGEAHVYRLALKKGAWRVQVFARTLGAPVDPKIWIRAAASAGQKNLLEADDAQSALVCNVPHQTAKRLSLV